MNTIFRKSINFAFDFFHDNVTKLVKFYIKLILRHKFAWLFSSLNDIDMNIEKTDTIIIVHISKFNVDIEKIKTNFNFYILDKITLKNGIVITIPFDTFPKLKYDETTILIDDVKINVDFLNQPNDVTKSINLRFDVSEINNYNNFDDPDLTEDIHLKMIEEYLGKVVDNLEIKITNLKIKNSQIQLSVEKVNIYKLSSVNFVNLKLSRNEFVFSNIESLFVSNTSFIVDSWIFNIDNNNNLQDFTNLIMYYKTKIMELIVIEENDNKMNFQIEKIIINYFDEYNIEINNINFVNCCNISNVQISHVDGLILKIDNIIIDKTKIAISSINYLIYTHIIPTRLINDIVNCVSTDKEDLTQSCVFNEIIEINEEQEDDFIFIDENIYFSDTNIYLKSTIFDINIKKTIIGLIDGDRSITININNILCKKCEKIHNQEQIETLLFKFESIFINDNSEKSAWKNIMYNTFDDRLGFSVDFISSKKNKELHINIEPLTLNLDHHILEFILKIIKTNFNESNSQNDSYNINKCHINSTILTVSYKPPSIDYSELMGLNPKEFLKIGVLRDIELKFNDKIICNSDFSTLALSIVNEWLRDIKTKNLNKCIFSLEPLKYIYQFNKDIYAVTFKRDKKQNIKKLIQNSTTCIVDLTTKTIFALQYICDTLYGNNRIESKLANYPMGVTDGLSKAQECITISYENILNNPSTGTILYNTVNGSLDSLTKILLGIHSAISYETAEKRKKRYDSL